MQAEGRDDIKALSANDSVDRRWRQSDTERDVCQILEMPSPTLLKGLRSVQFSVFPRDSFVPPLTEDFLIWVEL